MGQFGDAIQAFGETFLLPGLGHARRNVAKTRDMYKQREYVKEHEKFAEAQQAEFELTGAPMMEAQAEVDAARMDRDEAEDADKDAAQNTLDKAQVRLRRITIQTLTKKQITLNNQLGHPNPVTAEAAKDPAQANMLLLERIHQRDQQEGDDDMARLEEEGRMKRGEAEEAGRMKERGWRAEARSAELMQASERAEEGKRQFNMMNQGHQLKLRAKVVGYARAERAMGRSDEEIEQGSHGLIAPGTVDSLFDGWAGMSDELREEAVTLKSQIAEQESLKASPEEPDSDAQAAMKLRLKEVLAQTGAVWKNENEWRLYGQKHGAGQRKVAEFTADMSETVKETLRAAVARLFKPPGQVPSAPSSVPRDVREKAEAEF